MSKLETMSTWTQLHKQELASELQQPASRVHINKACWIRGGAEHQSCLRRMPNFHPCTLLLPSKSRCSLIFIFFNSFSKEKKKSWKKYHSHCYQWLKKLLALWTHSLILYGVLCCMERTVPVPNEDGTKEKIKYASVTGTIIWVHLRRKAEHWHVLLCFPNK